MKKIWKYTIGVIAIFFIAGLLLPENSRIPVVGASGADWNHETFWYEPWGASEVHKGIDIFGIKGTDVVAPTYGIVVFTGNIENGGNVVAILGPKWRFHYLAHLDTIDTSTLEILNSGERIGTLGDSGNAIGKQPHTHYSILTFIPYFWLYSSDTQGWKKMFFINPHEQLIAL